LVFHIQRHHRHHHHTVNFNLSLRFNYPHQVLTMVFRASPAGSNKLGCSYKC
jgi:hypothetical protein